MNKIKKRFNNFLKNLEKANEESFGGKKVDCCGLNSRNNNPTNKNITKTEKK